MKIQSKHISDCNLKKHVRYGSVQMLKGLKKERELTHGCEDTKTDNVIRDAWRFMHNYVAHQTEDYENT